MDHTCEHCDGSLVGNAYRVTSEEAGITLLDIVVCSLCFMEAKRLHLHAEEIDIRSKPDFSSKPRELPAPTWHLTETPGSRVIWLSGLVFLCSVRGVGFLVSRNAVEFKCVFCVSGGVYLKTNLISIPICEIVVSICHVVACRADHCIRNIVLRLTVWLNLVRGTALLVVGSFPHSA